MDMLSSMLEIRIPACVEGAELSGLMACQEFLGLWEQGGALTIYWQGSEAVMRQSLNEALAQLNVTIPNVAIHVQLVEHQDWNAQWAASVKPIRIGGRIGVRPSWATMDMPEDGIEIILDPRQAFGTGHHATTHLLLEWLEKMPELKKAKILDVGTGSAILSMVALRLGAFSALGIDLDPIAIECAKDYAVMNGFSEELDLRCCQMGDLVSQPFDIIVANIDRKTLLEISSDFLRLRSIDSKLLLSGLLEEDECDVVEEFTGHGWVRQAIRVREGWIALQFDAVPF